MFSDTRYNLTRYSVNQEAKTLPVSERFLESMGAVAGGSVPVDFQERYGEAVQGVARGTVSVTCSLSAGSELGCLARLRADVLVQLLLSTALWSAVRGQKDTPATMSASEELTQAVCGSKNIPAAQALDAALGAVATGSKDILASMAAAEVLTALLSATSQTTQRAVFQLTLPPGGELRIDSGLFAVLLDGENALHTQSGDWIDMSRELLRLVVESASGGGLEGQLIYTERFL